MTASQPVVSIVTPSFNRAHTISQTLESIQAQTFNAWECLVVDDGSTDGTAEVVNRFAESDPRIRMISRSRLPKGACTCRNIGVEHSRGDYVLFLDDDDAIAPFCLEQRVNAFTSAGDVDFVVFPALVFKQAPGDEDLFWNILTNESDLMRFLQLDSPWQGTGPLWKREAFVSLGGWSERLMCWQDVELAIRGFHRGISYQTRYDLPPDLYLRRGDGHSISSNSLRSPEKLASKKEVLEAATPLMEGNTDPRMSRAIKSLATAVIVDHAVGRASRQAMSLAWQSANRGIYSKGELILVLLGIVAQLRGASRVLGGASMRRMMAAYFGSASTIGRVKYVPSSSAG